MYVKIFVTKLNALSLKFSRNNHKNSLLRETVSPKTIWYQDLKSVCCKVCNPSHFLYPILLRTYKHGIYSSFFVFSPPLLNARLVFFLLFLSNKAQSSMESAWQRVESMHRWILENGGMIFFFSML